MLSSASTPRCLGATTDSSNVPSLLRSLIQQMDYVFRPKSIPTQVMASRFGLKFKGFR